MPRLPRHPAVLDAAARRSADVQLRVADAITNFAGSMLFIYLHVVAFGVWMVLVEKNPWPTLTLVVSLEAIFLSAFVLIGQNRQGAIQQAKADHDYAQTLAQLTHNAELTESVKHLTEALARHNRDVTP